MGNQSSAEPSRDATDAAEYPHKRRDFVVGFFGWLALNMLGIFIWFVTALAFFEGGSTSSVVSVLLVVVPSLLNIAAFILLFRTRRWMAFGAFTGLAVFLLIPLLLGAGTGAICFTYIFPYPFLSESGL